MRQIGYRRRISERCTGKRWGRVNATRKTLYRSLHGPLVPLRRNVPHGLTAVTTGATDRPVSNDSHPSENGLRARLHERLIAPT